MNRYYYTDPLAAAWMAKHFGMRFENPQDVETAATLSKVVAFMMGCGKGESVAEFAPKIRIHPDSLHLLEPMVGDLIIDGAIPQWCGGAIKNDDRIIIQRNGIPFHWPEVEHE